jgi:hypothetical protein
MKERSATFYTDRKGSTMSVQPFTLPYSEAAVEDLRSRVGRTRWPDEIPGSGWEYGVDLSYMRQLCDYWKDRFDWQAQLKGMSAFHHYRCTVDCVGIHFIHERGKGPVPIPLILTHGWPGSFLEMLKIIPLLTDPASYGEILRIPSTWSCHLFLALDFPTVPHSPV